jgi:DNA-binding transcriptional LysR family regulator
VERRVAESETSSETSPVDLADLRAFCLVVDQRSVTAAAKALGQTKGNISRRITRLERALGVALLRRSPRVVQATEDGAAYRMQVGKILEMLDDANGAVARARATPTGHLRVTAPNDMAGTLAPLVVDFSARYPDITVEMVLTQAVLDFDAHQLDVALRAARTLADSQLIAHKLREAETALYASPAYLKKNRAPQEPQDLQDHKILGFQYARGHGTLVMWRLVNPRDEVRIRLRSAVSAVDFAFLTEAAVAGGGIAMLPTLNAQRYIRDGSLVPVLKAWGGGGASFYLLHQGGRFVPSKVRVFRDYMLDAFAARGRRR